MKKMSVLKEVTGFIAFMLIICIIFSGITWVFRGNDSESREDILGFRNEINNMDVILFGASDVLRFYDPLEAWNQKGYTSYNYATSAAQADMLRFFAEESRKTNRADLYVFDLRTITLLDDSISELALRNWSDSVSVFSTTRARGIASYIFTRNWSDVDVPSYFIDIIRYHGNHDSLSSSYQWKYINKEKMYNTDKGFEPYTNHTPFEPPNIINDRGALSKQQLNALIELIKYCDKEGLNALFISSPFINETDYALINAVGDYIEDNGYTFVDFNRFYDEMGIDFETDFGDVNHVNYLGAKKFTDCLINYLSSNYGLPDHRGDDKYNRWDQDYSAMMSSREQWIDEMNATIDSHLEAKVTGERLSQIDNIEEWISKIQNENFSVVILKDGQIEYSYGNRNFDEFLYKYGIDLSHNNYAGIWSGETCLFSTYEDESTAVNIGVDGGRGYDQCIAALGDDPQLSINNVNYYDRNEIFQIIVYDNNYKKIIDNVSIHADSGEVFLVR